MLPQSTSTTYQSPTCSITYGSMSRVGSGQKPSKDKPWSSITAMDFVQKVDLIIPQEGYETVRRVLEQRTAPTYYKVKMSVVDILQGDFFTEYIKRGNILMISESKFAGDNVFTLREGILTMYLEQEDYERSGLVGKSVGVKSSRGSRPKWVVTYDLRSPSMLHGKRSFDRLVHGCKQVLSDNADWLFCNIAKTAPQPDPIQTFNPICCSMDSEISREMLVKCHPMAIPPSLIAAGDRDRLEELATGIYEWISLVRLDSPRVQAVDTVDPYLSRYEVPDGTHEDTQQVCRVSLRGFLDARWVRDLLVEVFDASASEPWCAVSSTGFMMETLPRNAEVLVLKPPSAKTEYLLWHIGFDNGS